MTEDLWSELVIMPTLLGLAIQDKRYLGVARPGLAIASGLLLAVGFFREVSWQSRAGGLALGALLLLSGYFSKEAIGVADGIVVSVCGVSLGVYESATMCFFAAGYTAAFALILLLLKKVGKKSRLPFLPFLLLGYITMRFFVRSL